MLEKCKQRLFFFDNSEIHLIKTPSKIQRSETTKLTQETNC